MTGNTGYTAPVATDANNPPADMTTIYEHFDSLIGETADTVAHLPSTGRWVGRTVWVQDAGAQYVWNGSAWVATSNRPRLALIKDITQNSIATGTAVAITWSTSAASVDVGGFYTPGTSTSNIVVPVAGTYRFLLSVVTNSAGNIRLSYSLNGASGVTSATNVSTSGVGAGLTGLIVLTLSASDSVRFAVNASTSANILVGTTNMTAELIG